jgi:hypothetical protein
MVIHFTNINKTNNHFASQLNSLIIKKTTRCDVRNPDPGLDPETKMLSGYQLPPLDNGISNENTYINKQ